MLHNESMPMTNDRFEKLGIGAVDALRLFASNVSRDDTVFEGNSIGSARTAKETIRYRSLQCWGDIVRTRDGITISVIPKIGFADNFVARRLNFSTLDYAQSWMITASPEEFLEYGGKSYSYKLAELLVRHLSKTRLQFKSDDGEYMVMIANSPEGQKISDNVWKLAQAVDLELQGSKSYIRYPSLDVQGVVAQRDPLGALTALNHITSLNARNLIRAARELPNVLMFRQGSHEYPIPFDIHPLAYTAVASQNRAKTLAKALGAAALTEIWAENIEIFEPFEATIVVDCHDGQNPEALAEIAYQNFLGDWNYRTLGEITPRLAQTGPIDHGHSFEGASVTILLEVELDAAERYNQEGKYKLIAR